MSGSVGVLSSVSTIEAIDGGKPEEIRPIHSDRWYVPGSVVYDSAVRMWRGTALSQNQSRRHQQYSYSEQLFDYTNVSLLSYQQLYGQSNVWVSRTNCVLILHEVYDGGLSSISM
ncbi:hypothetical protein GCM10009067_26980 [Haloarcula sebkhae]|uniref:Uncharacterized protein n=1 Tax=Haloarcula sebkhae TaxID=932660 RepID=A0A830F0L9_9EURY|nr:hypothetical protein GCM10009067_26980 [Haloarcula sebkhae]